MKKLLVMCGSGIATSTVVMNKVKDWLKAEGLEKEVTLFQSKVAEEANRLDEYDVVISTTAVPDNLKDKVIMAVPLLTGIGADKVFEEIKAELSK